SVLPPDLHSFPTRRSSDLFQPRPRSIAPCGSRGRFPHHALSLCTDTASVCRFGFALPGTQWRRRGSTLRKRESPRLPPAREWLRSEEHTSELQSRVDLVCR